MLNERVRRIIPQKENKPETSESDPDTSDSGVESNSSTGKLNEIQMNMTFDKHFIKNEPRSQVRAKTMEKDKRKSEAMSKSPPPPDHIQKNPKEKGTDRLLLISKDLSLNVKSKNIMDPKILEEWANETLIEVERLDNRNDGIPLEKKNPLKRYGIDRQSLEGMGLSKDNISRLFRCMFVYSAGFYEMLHDMFEHSPKKFNLVGSVWKVFWILLEYCYKADHQTIIEEVNRENNEHLSRVSRELAKKTKELDDLIKWKETYLENYEKTTETLMMEKENLLREKVRLEEDCKINEKAYTDEVQLRIKFENKINDFYANYRDLQAKNGRILEELVNLQKKNEEAAGINLELKQKMNSLNDRNAELNNLVKTYQEKVSDKESLLDEVQKEKAEIEKRLLQAMKANQEIDKRKLQTEVDNQKFKVSSLSSVNQMYQRNIEELKLVISNKEDEIRQANQKYKNLEIHYEEKNKQNLEHEKEMIKYKNLSQMLEEKVASQKKELDKISEKFESLFKNHSEITHSKVSVEEKSKTLEKDREEALTNIEKLSEARRELEHKFDKSREELDIVLRGIEELKKQIELLQEQKLKLESFITEQKDRLVDQQNEINKKRLEVQHYKDDIHNIEEHHKEVLKKERENVELWQQRFEKEQVRCANLADKILKLESKIVVEIEEKENYKIRVYELEKKNATQEVLVHEAKSSVSENVRQKEMYEREYKLIKNLLETAKAEYAQNIQHYKIELNEAKLGFRDHYHPMVVEEILSRLHEDQFRIRELETKLIEEVQRNTNQNYRAAKKNNIIQKFEKLSKSLLEERKILIKEREELLHECLKFKNREKALKQQSENNVMTIKEYKQEIGILKSKLFAYDQERRLQTENSSPGKPKKTQDQKTIKKMREQILDILKTDITVKKVSRPKSEENLPKQKSSSAQASTSNLERALTQPDEEDPQKKKAKHRYSLPNGKQNPNFKIRRTSLLNKTTDDALRTEGDRTRNDDEAYALIEELFSQKLTVDQILELAKQQTFNSGIDNIELFFSNIRNAIESEPTTDPQDKTASVDLVESGTLESKSGSKTQSITMPGKIKRTKTNMTKKRSENSSPDHAIQNTNSPISHVAKTSMITPPPKPRARAITSVSKADKQRADLLIDPSSDRDSSVSSSFNQSNLNESKQETGYNFPSRLESPERKLIRPMTVESSNTNPNMGSLDLNGNNNDPRIDINRTFTENSKEEFGMSIEAKNMAIQQITEETPKQGSNKSFEESLKKSISDNQNSRSDNSIGKKSLVESNKPEIPKIPIKNRDSQSSKPGSQQNIDKEKVSPMSTYYGNYPEEFKMGDPNDSNSKTQPKIIMPVSNELSNDKNNQKGSIHTSGRKSIDLGVDEKQMQQQIGETQDLERLTQHLAKHTIPNKKQPNQPIVIDIKALVDSLKNRAPSRGATRPATSNLTPDNGYSGPKESLFTGTGIRKLIQISKHHNS